MAIAVTVVTLLCFAIGADAAHGNFNVSGQNVNLTIALIFDDLVDAQYTFTGQPITFGRGMGALTALLRLLVKTLQRTFLTR